jgi:pimeloyl-ACP methyl ester carboxylesterase
MKHFFLNGFELWEHAPPAHTPPKACLFFAPANGIPAQTYHMLFETMARTLNLSIFSYNMRGMGNTRHSAVLQHPACLWQILTDDHISLFCALQQQRPFLAPWILAGHSLGAWVSLLSTQTLNINKVFLFDMPLLSPTKAILWCALKMLGKSHFNPLSARTKKRKTHFTSYHEAVQELQKSALMKHWPPAVVEHYVAACFQHEMALGEGPHAPVFLKHNPQWEALLFEAYPPLAFLFFLKIPKKVRQKLKPLFFAGERSTVCASQAKQGVRLFFPGRKWIVVPQGSHMFVLEDTLHTLECVQKEMEGGEGS